MSEERQRLSDLFQSVETLKARLKVLEARQPTSLDCDVGGAGAYDSAEQELVGRMDALARERDEAQRRLRAILEDELHQAEALRDFFSNWHSHMHLRVEKLRGEINQ